MSTPEQSSGGADKVMAWLGNKTGPLPNGAWLFVGVVVVMFVMKARKGPGGSQSSTDKGTFTSSQSLTDPKTGQTTSYTATGPTSGFLTGGALTTEQASPMGYSGGDVYVNYPGQTTAPPQQPRDYDGPAYPPQHAAHAGSGQTGSWWYTLPKDVLAADLPNEVYQLGVGPNPSQATNRILAADLINIMNANPQIDWTRAASSPGTRIPAGTPIYVPLAGGNAGAPPPSLPAHASYDAPPNYTPPNQTTTMSTTMNSGG